MEREVEAEPSLRVKMSELSSERLTVYKEIWQSLAEERSALQDLYTELNASDISIQFSVELQVDIEGWLERGLDLFDRRRELPLGSEEALRGACRARWKPAWESCEPERCADAVEELRVALKALGREPVLRAGYSRQDLLAWIYSTDHVQLRFGLRHSGLELRKLSPGTRGIVLLMVYLGLDRTDTCPLIVDQPEENLDNESIYESLVDYFRRAKRRRQILLVTHNPNLVVNADADQVIVATCSRQDDGRPLMLYRSGSLENIGPAGGGIRDAVCRILEGGSEAFLKREGRYHLGSSQ